MIVAHILGLIGIAIFYIIIGADILYKDSKYSILYKILWSITLASTTFWMFRSLKYEIVPQAIDVYRNNTELYIKYEIVNNDTISIDSTVVFKN